MPQQAQTLAQTIRAKFPGSYNDVDDDTLEKNVLAKYPQYGDMPRTQGMKQPAGQAGTYVSKPQEGSVNRLARSFNEATTGAGDITQLPQVAQGLTKSNIPPWLDPTGGGITSALNIGKNVAQGSSDLWRQAEQYPPWSPSRLIRKAYSSIPVLGPLAVKGAEQLEGGNTAGGIGTGLGMGMMLAGGDPEAKTGLAEAATRTQDVVEPAMRRVPGNIGNALRTEKGALRPGVRAIARAGGAAAGHWAGMPGMGELGGFILGPNVADALIPERSSGPPGWSVKIPNRVPTGLQGSPTPFAEAESAEGVPSSVPKPSGRLVVLPQEAQALEQMQKIATKRASEHGMQYAAGMRPAGGGRVPMTPTRTTTTEYPAPGSNLPFLPKQEASIPQGTPTPFAQIPPEPTLPWERNIPAESEIEAARRGAPGINPATRSLRRKMQKGNP